MEMDLLQIIIFSMFAVIVIFLLFIVTPIFVRLNNIRKAFWKDLFARITEVSKSIQGQCIERLSMILGLEEEAQDI
jgi:hypothetical protein